VNVVTYFNVSNDTNATGKGAIAAYNRASSQTCATGYRGIFPDATVVSNLHLIIDYYTILNNRMSQRSPVHGCASTDLNAIPQPHTTELTDLFPALWTGGISKAISPENGLRMNHAILTQMHIVVNHSVG
jgi:hypothetical protein